MIARRPGWLEIAVRLLAESAKHPSWGNVDEMNLVACGHVEELGIIHLLSPSRQRMLANT